MEEFIKYKSKTFEYLSTALLSTPMCLAISLLLIFMFKFIITIINFCKYERVVTSKSVFMSEDNFIVVHSNKIISRILENVHV